MRLMLLALLLALATPALADDFNSKVYIKFEVQPTRSLDLVTINAPLSYSKTFTLTSGTSTNQAQQMFTDSRALAASTSESIDLAASLTNGFGQTITFTAIKCIYIENLSTSTTTFSIGGAASNQFINWVADASDIIKIRPGGCVLLMAPDATGYAVTAATGDILKVLNDHSAEQTYKIVIIGEGTAS